MLAALDTLSAAAGLHSRELHLARVAAWLHDAVYDVHAPAGDSERESAALARKLLPSLGVASADIRSVEALILLTIDHGDGLAGALADVFTDADLAILAAPAERFDAYCSQVRAEYSHVPEASYNQARSAILAALVGRPEVYRTSFARSEWTAAARGNVAREIGRLG
jgi:predicted metal-dependent HD superfamily phosphohydrolase